MGKNPEKHRSEIRSDCFYLTPKGLTAPGFFSRGASFVGGGGGCAGGPVGTPEGGRSPLDAGGREPPEVSTAGCTNQRLGGLARATERGTPPLLSRVGMDIYITSDQNLCDSSK